MEAVFFGLHTEGHVDGVGLTMHQVAGHSSKAQWPFSQFWKIWCGTSPARPQQCVYDASLRRTRTGVSSVFLITADRGLSIGQCSQTSTALVSSLRRPSLQSHNACGSRRVHWHSLSAVSGTLVRRGRSEPENAEFRRFLSRNGRKAAFVPMKREIMALVIRG